MKVREEWMEIERMEKLKRRHCETKTCERESREGGVMSVNIKTQNVTVKMEQKGKR